MNGMGVFADETQFYAVMKEVFDYIAQHPQHIESFTRSNLVIRMRTTQPDAELLLDGRQPPLQVFLGSTPGLANLEISLPADLLQQAKSLAALSGVSLKQFYLDAIQLKLDQSQPKRTRRTPPCIGKPDLGAVNLTREQIDEAMFG